MSEIKVKFKEKGKWADSPSEPIFEVEKDDERLVSASFANMLVKSGKGKIVKIKEEPVKLEEGSACDLKDGKEGVIKDGKCIKVK